MRVYKSNKDQLSIFSTRNQSARMPYFADFSSSVAGCEKQYAGFGNQALIFERNTDLKCVLSVLLCDHAAFHSIG